MYIKEIQIENIRSISKLTWTIPEDNAAGWHVVIGDNGSGKTSVMRALAGLVPLSGGRIVLDGQVLEDPRAGMVTIYDRSWYGRVLVERLEGYARDDEWRRAFGEINDFETQLSEHGIIVLKFWLQIGKDEQLRRFRDREETDYKRHKINAEDWRNRRKWHAYEIAVGDMLALTNHADAPWHLVPANNKRHARLQIIKASCKEIEAALER